MENWVCILQECWLGIWTWPGHSYFSEMISKDNRVPWDLGMLDVFVTLHDIFQIPHTNQKGSVYVRNYFSASKNFWKWFLHRAETFRICVNCWKTIFGDTLSSLRGRPQQPQYYQNPRLWTKTRATKATNGSELRDLRPYVCNKITFAIVLVHNLRYC